MRTSSSAGFDLWGAVDGLREAFTLRVAERMGHGDIRTAILAALVDEPMHGYQIIRAIEAQTRGAWKPGPGSVYPTLQLLADEGLVSFEQVGERKVYSLTEAGRSAAAELSNGPASWHPLRSWDPERSTALPRAGAKLAQVVVQFAHADSAEQAERATAVLDEARRKLYAILAED